VSGLLSGELPFDARTGSVSLSLPGFDFDDEGLPFADAAIQTLAMQHADFDFHHIELARVLGRVMKLQALQDAIWLNQFVAGQGTPEPPAAPTVSAILDGYLADRESVVRAYDTLEVACKALRRHLGDLQSHHLTTERIRFYRARRRAEGHQVGPADARRKKITSDGTLIRELVTLRAALKWAKQAKWISGDLPHIEVPSQPPPRDRRLTRDEADRLLALRRCT
jgi:hypothetical protein